MDNLDKIIIKNLKIFAYHGNNPEEKVKGQNFFIDCTAYISNQNNINNSDSLSDTVSYSKIIKKINEIVINNKFNLIETVAEKIAENLLLEFTKILKCDIKVKKPEAPINAIFDYVAIEISRKRVDHFK